MLRKLHLLLFIGLLSSIFYLPNTFADKNGDPIDIENIIAEGNFAFPTAEGPAYIQGTDEFQRVPENIIGTNDIEKVRDLPTSSQDYQLSRKVGWIITRSRSNPNLFHTCTGFLVGPDLFMTNHHCINDAAGTLPVESMYIFMDYYQDRSVDPTRGGVTARVSGIVRMDAAKDYALLRLNSAIGNTYGWLDLDTTTRTNTTQSVKLISHNGGRSKEIVRNNSQIVAVPSLIARYPFILAYLADSESGSSGSPVFLRDGAGVIAIHHSGWSDNDTGEPLFNAGSLMSYIVPEIQQYLPASDLIVETFRVPTDNIDPGESFGLSATVKNRGNVPSPATTLRFYQRDGTTQTQIGTANVSTLNPNGTATLTLMRTAPTTAGIHTYEACVDTVTNENNTNNNCSPSITITVSNPDRPDLAVVEAPGITDDDLRPGESFGLSATVRNRGGAASPATTLRFYQRDGTTRTEIGTANVGPLNPGETATRTLTQTAPLTVGTHTYEACVDTVTDENNTNNNCSPAVRITVSVPAPPVIVPVLAFNPPTVVVQTFRVGEAVNLILPVVTGGTPPYVYTLTPLPGGLSFSATQRVLSGTPTTVTSATRATYTATDATDASISLNFTIEVVAAASPDLAVLAAPTVTADTLRPGESFGLSATVRNRGDAPSPETTLRFYKHTDSVKTEIGTVSDVGPLNPGETAEFRIIHTAPMTVGTHTYEACVDTVTDENNTNNNCSPAVRITVLEPDPPDLIVEALVVTNADLRPGESFGLSATVKNIGDISSPATTLRFYKRDGTARTEIGTVSDVGPLNAGETATRTLTHTASDALGTHTYEACVDTVTDENNTNNNCSPAVTVSVTVPVYMYWVDAGTDKIQRADLDGANIEDIVTTGLRTPTSIAVDVEGGKVYWADSRTDKIQRADLDGANIEDIVTTGLRTPTSIAVDIAGGKIYWIDDGTDKIQRADLDGSNIEDIITTGLRTPTSIAVDLKWGKVYWIDADTDKIQRADLDGANIEDIVTTGLIRPIGIAVDMISDKIYWTDAGTDKVQRADLDGSNIEDIVITGLRTPTDITVDPLDPEDPLDTEKPLGGKVYWIDAGTDTIHRADLDGANIEDIVTTGLRTPSGIALGIPQIVPARPPGPAPSPGPSTPAADVDADGRVTVIDLAIVAVFYGTQVPADGNLRADVNADGIVNILDLTVVANAIEVSAEPPADIVGVLEAIAAIEAIAAAPGHISRGHRGTRRNTPAKTPLRAGAAHQNVAMAFADAKHLAPADAALGKWMPVLKELLLTLAEMQEIPDTTALLPNYPNPFNPETWIPYHLSKGAAVTLTIHDVRGVLVRELTLGYQAAGIYESRAQAAYWDGKNSVGEPVVSGVYFYTLSTESTRDSVTAGEFTATRKLLIIK